MSAGEVGDQERWDARYRSRTHQDARPSPLPVSLQDVLPRRAGAPARAPPALDVAGGAGRNAVWLARRGLEVTLADVSPVALGLARSAADAAGVTLRLVEVDLESSSLPPGPFDLIVSIDFLCRPLLAAFPAVLRPGGLLVYAQATRRNLERHAHPSARFLLAEGELRTLVAGLEVWRDEEGWFDGRREARLLTRKP